MTDPMRAFLFVLAVSAGYTVSVVVCPGCVEYVTVPCAVALLGFSVAHIVTRERRRSVRPRATVPS